MNLNQVTIPAMDVSSSVAFYQKLGLKLIVNALPDYARLECPDGEATFSIHRESSPTKGQGAIIYFESENLDAEVKRLMDAGVTFDSGPRDEPWLWREARLKDPDQNRIVLFYAGQNRKFPPWRVGE
ncbi:VOC family protein [Flavobacteriaceae bacterium D16]|nr:VOC family protein [Flavobacteriaceae bacterium D16]